MIAIDLDSITEADIEEPIREKGLHEQESVNFPLYSPQLLPSDIEVEVMQTGEYKLSRGEMSEVVHFPTKPDYFVQNPKKFELCLIGSSLFPKYSIKDTKE